VKEFPSSWGDVLTDKYPRLKLRKGLKGRIGLRGTRISKYGMTPEEELMKYAPEGTKPERMVFGWLVRHGYSFEFQESVAGGRIPGGAVVDFCVYDKYPPMAIRIQSYWHESAEVQWSDSIQLDTLINMGFQVEDIWEYEVNTVAKVDRKMREVIFGAPKFSTVTAYVSTTGERCPICGDPYCTKCSW